MIDLDRIKGIRIERFDYPLPDSQIPRHPLQERDRCKLMVNREGDAVEHRLFYELPELLPANSLLVCNETRVINARISFEKSTGSKIEVFLLEPLSPSDYVLMFQAQGSCEWGCMVGNLKRWKQNPLEKKLMIDGREVELRAYREEALGGNSHRIRFEWDQEGVTFASVVEAAGYIPIPPYLKRASEECDADDYQTVYARVKGSVAAPTAGLHFTDEVFSNLRAKGITIAPISLHVGAGTFQPVKSEAIGDHPMHTEVFTVERSSLVEIIEARRSGRPITAVGTTSVRTLESLPYLGRKVMNGDDSMSVIQWEAYETSMPAGEVDRALEALVEYLDTKGLNSLTASTSIMIAPGFEWKMVNAMVTNFHQPESTLLLLVSSFIDRGQVESVEAELPLWRALYNEALKNNYRFLSYGDACLFIR